AAREAGQLGVQPEGRIDRRAFHRRSTPRSRPVHRSFTAPPYGVAERAVRRGGAMLGVTLSRAARSPLPVWVVVSAVFLVLRLSGDPAQAMLPDDATPRQIEGFRWRFGLDQPLPVQYARYLSRAARGDFGLSLRERRPALDLVRERLPATVQLGVAAATIALLLGIPAGVLAAGGRGRVLDRLRMAAALPGPCAARLS